MMFTLKIKTDNAAFEDKAGEVARILRVLAAKLEGGEDGAITLTDYNGNSVGQAKLS